MDLRVADTSSAGVYMPLIVLAAPRALVSKTIVSLTQEGQRVPVSCSEADDQGSSDFTCSSRDHH